MSEICDVDVNPDQLAEIRRILSEHVPECEVRAFGSRITGHAKPWSDLDLVVVGPTVIHWNHMGKLAEAFQESELPFRVDVMDWNATSPAFQKVIEENYRVIQRNSPDAMRA